MLRTIAPTMTKGVMATSSPFAIAASRTGRAGDETLSARGSYCGQQRPGAQKNRHEPRPGVVRSRHLEARIPEHEQKDESEPVAPSLPPQRGATRHPRRRAAAFHGESFRAGTGIPADGSCG